MAAYLLIESRHPSESADVATNLELASTLAAHGHDVTVYLVQNGVLPARSGARNEPLTEVARGGVTVLADDFSLRERGIGTDRLVAGVSSAPLEVVVDSLVAGAKVIWH